MQSYISLHTPDRFWLSGAGDGDCGYRALALGLILALHALHDAAACQAFFEHVQALCIIPLEMLAAQHEGMRHASASLGLAFFKVGYVDVLPWHIMTEQLLSHVTPNISVMLLE